MSNIQVAELLKQLQAVHSDIRARFQYVTDKKQFNVEEYWYTPDVAPGLTIKGDCEEFALACWKLCRERGLDQAKICIAKFRTGPEKGRGHAVMYCDGYVLDVNRRFVRTAKELSTLYEWLALSSMELGDPWYRIEGFQE